MSTLRRTLAGLLAALLLVLGAPPAHADEAQVRAALAACVEAWNRHEPKAFGDTCLTADVWFSESDDSFYKRFQGREKVLSTFGYNIANSDLQWDVVRVQAQPDGSFAVQLKQRVGMLPRNQGRYASVFESDPSFARLRRDGGAWKVYFYTSDAGWARALMQQAWGGAAPAVVVSTPPAARVDARVTPGIQPPAYAVQFGELSESCFACHGRQPTVSEDGDRGRIVASGAGAESAAALRRAMTTQRAGRIMDRVLADPALTDEHLDAIRLWLRAMRDGRAERLADRIVIHNPRSERDPPARLALLRAEGGWRLPANAGCRQGATISGGKHCEIRLSSNSRGTLVFRFAASPGLQPEEVRLTLDER
jgi:mono/diheme cytochrome c family protein